MTLFALALLALAAAAVAPTSASATIWAPASMWPGHTPFNRTTLTTWTPGYLGQGPYTTLGGIWGSYFQTSSGGAITQLWWYSNSTSTNNTKLHLRRNDAPTVDIIPPVVVATGANAWLSVDLASPVPILRDVLYVVYREIYAGASSANPLLYTTVLPSVAKPQPLINYMGYTSDVFGCTLVACPLNPAYTQVTISGTTDKNHLVDVTFVATEPASTVTSMWPLAHPVPSGIATFTDSTVQNSGGIFGTVFNPNLNGVVTDIWWYHDTTLYGSTTALHLRAASSLTVDLAVVRVANVATTGWRSVKLPAPVPLSADQTYYVYREQYPSLTGAFYHFATVPFSVGPRSGRPVIYGAGIVAVYGTATSSCTPTACNIVPTGTLQPSYTNDLLVDVTFDFTPPLPPAAAVSSSTGAPAAVAAVSSSTGAPAAGVAGALSSSSSGGSGNSTFVGDGSGSTAAAASPLVPVLVGAGGLLLASAAGFGLWWWRVRALAGGVRQLQKRR
jgi:hypothetical protein